MENLFYTFNLFTNQMNDIMSRLIQTNKSMFEEFLYNLQSQILHLNQNNQEEYYQNTQNEEIHSYFHVQPQEIWNEGINRDLQEQKESYFNCPFQVNQDDYNIYSPFTTDKKSIDNQNNSISMYAHEEDLDGGTNKHQKKMKNKKDSQHNKKKKQLKKQSRTFCIHQEIEKSVSNECLSSEENQNGFQTPVKQKIFQDSVQLHWKDFGNDSFLDIKRSNNQQGKQTMEVSQFPDEDQLRQLDEQVLSSSSKNQNSILSQSKTIKKGKVYPSVILIDGVKKYECKICQEVGIKKQFVKSQCLGGHKARTHPDAPCQRTERLNKKKLKESS